MSREWPAVDYTAKSHRRKKGRPTPRLSVACFTPRQLAVWVGLGVLSALWLLPATLRDRVGSGLGRLHYRLGKNHYRAARRNLRLCFPEMSEAAIRELLVEHSATQWCVWLDLPALWMQPLASLRARTDYENLEILLERASNKQPVLLIVCHNVALEHVAHSLKSMLPLLGYYKRFKSPVLDWLFYRIRSRNGGYLTERDESMHALMRDVSAGWQLYQMIDEDLGADMGEFAPLFATEFCVVVSTARMCRITGAAAVPVFSGYDRRRHRYQVKVYPPLQSFPVDDARCDAETLCGVLELLISASPPQFMWHQRMFKTRSGQAKSPYLDMRAATD